MKRSYVELKIHSDKYFVFQLCDIRYYIKLVDYGIRSNLVLVETYKWRSYLEFWYWSIDC